MLVHDLLYISSGVRSHIDGGRLIERTNVSLGDRLCFLLNLLPSRCGSTVKGCSSRRTRRCLVGGTLWVPGYIYFGLADWSRHVRSIEVPHVRHGRLCGL